MARHPWTHEELVAGIRAGDHRALARAITLVENRDPGAPAIVSELYPQTGDGVLRRRHGPAGRRQVVADRGARPPRPGPRAHGGRHLGRSLEPVHAGRPARRQDPPRRPLPRPGRVHPLDGNPRSPRRPGRGDAPDAAAARRGGPRRDLPRDGRHRPERGRGDGHRGRGAPRPDARVRRFGAGPEGRDHGDPRRDRDQQDGSARREGAAERHSHRDGSQSRRGAAARRSCSPRRCGKRGSTRSGRRWSGGATLSSRQESSRSDAAGIWPPRSCLQRPLAPVPGSRSRSLRIPSLTELVVGVQERQVDPLTAVDAIVSAVLREAAP